MSLDVESVLAGLRAARREAIMAWCPSIAENGPEHTADHLMNALLDVELAIAQLEKSEDPGATRREAERIIEDAKQVQRDAEALIEDDEPSNVHATGHADDDPIALARSMQQRRHGGGS